MLILGHRGDRQKFEDNTIEGIASAFDRGADGVEIDVYFKPEKGIYLVHPYMHDQNKDFPRLEDVFIKFRSRGLIQIEIKFLETEGLSVIKGLVKKYEVKNYLLTSSVFPILRYIREFFPKTKINLLATRLVEDWWTEEFGDYFLLSYLKLTGADAIDIGRSDFWTIERVKKYHSLGIRTCGHLATDDKEEYESMVKMGLDACTADNLNVLKWRK